VTISFSKTILHHGVSKWQVWWIHKKLLQCSSCRPALLIWNITLRNTTACLWYSAGAVTW